MGNDYILSKVGIGPYKRRCEKISYDSLVRCDIDLWLC